MWNEKKDKFLKYFWDSTDLNDKIDGKWEIKRN